MTEDRRKLIRRMSEALMIPRPRNDASDAEADAWIERNAEAYAYALASGKGRE